MANLYGLQGDIVNEFVISVRDKTFSLIKKQSTNSAGASRFAKNSTAPKLGGGQLNSPLSPTPSAFHSPNTHGVPTSPPLATTTKNYAAPHDCALPKTVGEILRSLRIDIITWQTKKDKKN